MIQQDVGKKRLSLLGLGAVRLTSWLLPGLEPVTSWGYAAAALSVSVAVGLASGIAPARRAARLDPIVALRAE